MRVAGSPTREERRIINAMLAKEKREHKVIAAAICWVAVPGKDPESLPAAVRSNGSLAVYTADGNGPAMQLDLEYAEHTDRGSRIRYGAETIIVRGPLETAIAQYGTDKRTVDPMAPWAVRLDGGIDHAVHECFVLGGSGFPLNVRDRVILHFHDDGYSVWREGTPIWHQSYDDIEHLSIGGPGEQQVGGGFIGGGIGIEGAAIGIGIATALTALTTSVTVTTIIELATIGGELFLLQEKEAPEVMRIRLSPVFVRIRQQLREAASGSVAMTSDAS